MNQDRLRRLYGRHQRARGDGRHCPAPEALHALARGELPEAERLAAFDHVMACRSCGEEFELLRAIERAGKAEAAGAAPPASDDARVVRLSSRRARRWLAPLALAASVLVAVMVGRDDAREPMRGGADGPVLLAPPPTATAGSPLVFAWRPLPDARRYVLEVLAQDGSVALDAETTDTMVTPAGAERLAPGRYQWWVRALTAGGADYRSALRPLRILAAE